MVKYSMKNYLKLFFILFLALFIGACGPQSSDTKVETTNPIENKVSPYSKILTSNKDSDNDNIPDSIEILLNKDKNNNDENSNGIIDGIEGDELFKYQWHLNNIGQIVNNNLFTVQNDNDLNILKVNKYFMGYNHGNNITIQVTDTGVQKIHPDLNISNSSYNTIYKTNDPTASQGNFEDRSHGTMVSGIIAAKAFNNIGVRGIAPFAIIVANNWLESSQKLSVLEKLWIDDANSSNVSVSNNSWGQYFFDEYEYEEIMQIASTKLRNKKGVVFVFASGNERLDDDKYSGYSNLSYFTNNRYVVTVGAVTDKNKYSSYSNHGPCLLTCAYGGEDSDTSATITTTTLKGLARQTYSEDANKDYTYIMNGTSAATPMVSGVIALTLEACPNLSYRDIKWLIAKNSTVIDKSNDKWIQNASGLWFNENYGFGLINGYDMIKECTNNYTLLPEEKIVSTQKDFNTNILATNETLKLSLTINENIITEWVGLIIKSDHTYTGDLKIVLESPSGTKTTIIDKNELDDSHYIDGFRFSANTFMQEPTKGTWNIYITDVSDNDTGKINNIKLEIYGH